MPSWHRPGAAVEVTQRIRARRTEELAAAVAKAHERFTAIFDQAITRADGGTVQILDDQVRELMLPATDGFDAGLTRHFAPVARASVRAAGHSAFDPAVPSSGTRIRLKTSS